MAAYHRVEGTLPDASDNRAIERRLADLGRRIGAESDPQHTADWYKDAIARYKALLADPHNGDAEDILYHLAEAYDALDDRKETNVYLDRLIKEFPNSDYRVEAHFRRAELAFSAKDYDRAVDDYAFVVEQGRTSAYWQNANYMLGWSRFKQGEYEESLDSFLATVDAILAEDETPEGASKEMLDDTLRVGRPGRHVPRRRGDARPTASRRLHKPRWQYRVYERLADDLRGKQRIPRQRRGARNVRARKSVRSAIASRSPSARSKRSRRRNFPRRPANARKRSSSSIRFGADYWVVNGNELRDRYVPMLKTYLLEVARLVARDGQKEHQTAGAAARTNTTNSSSNVPPRPGRWRSSVPGRRRAHRRERTRAGARRVSAGRSRTSRRRTRPGRGLRRDRLARRAAANGQTRETIAMLTRTRNRRADRVRDAVSDAPHAAEVQVDAANTLFENHEYAEADGVGDGDCSTATRNCRRRRRRLRR